MSEFLLDSGWAPSPTAFSDLNWLLNYVIFKCRWRWRSNHSPYASWYMVRERVSRAQDIGNPRFWRWKSQWAGKKCKLLSLLLPAYCIFCNYLTVLGMFSVPFRPTTKLPWTTGRNTEGKLVSNLMPVPINAALPIICSFFQHISLGKAAVMSKLGLGFAIDRGIFLPRVGCVLLTSFLGM